jgi:hypothetical protein
MDILAHTLWTNAAARGANAAAKKNRVHVGWAAFWGVFPDFFAFTIPFVISLWGLLSGTATEFPSHRNTEGFNIAGYLYQYSHSMVVWAVVFIVVWVVRKRPVFELFGWLLHILIDIPSHSINFYPTPFLFPVSDYRFPYGVSWANPIYMIVNYTLLAAVWIGIFLRSRRKNVTVVPQQNDTNIS